MTQPALGFGTAPVLGRVGRRESLRALEHAYAAGIRHFDTARSYGWGDAEGLLGGFLKGRARDSFVLVSKCGIVPARRSPLLSVAKQVGRKIYSHLPFGRDLVRRAASSPQFQPQKTYDAGLLARSFETSIAELGVDRLDGLLLHNYEAGKEGLREVVAWLRELKRTGRILRYGFSIEGDLRAGLDHLVAMDALDGALVQAPVSRDLLQLPLVFREVPVFAHSPFRFLHAAVEPTRRMRDDFAHLLAVLAHVCRCETVVCSMFSPRHADDNARARELSALTGPEDVERELARFLATG